MSTCFQTCPHVSERVHVVCSQLKHTVRSVRPSASPATSTNHPLTSSPRWRAAPAACHAQRLIQRAPSSPSPSPPRRHEGLRILPTAQGPPSHHFACSRSTNSLFIAPLRNPTSPRHDNNIQPAQSASAPPKRLQSPLRKSCLRPLRKGVFSTNPLSGRPPIRL